MISATRSVPNYARPISVPRRRKVLNGLIITTLLIASFVIWHFEPRMAVRISILYWQYRCATFEQPPTLTTQPNQKAEDLYVGYENSLWRGGIRTQTESIVWSVVFLHELTSPGGRRDIVAIRLATDRHLLFGHTLAWTTVNRVDVFEPPIPRQGRFPIPFNLPDGIVVKSASLDPADPSHFVIRAKEIIWPANIDCLHWPDQNTPSTEVDRAFDGWLQDDGTIRSNVRK